MSSNKNQNENENIFSDQDHKKKEVRTSIERKDIINQLKREIENSLIMSISFAIILVLASFLFLNERYSQKVNSMIQTIDYLDNKIKLMNLTINYPKINTMNDNSNETINSMIQSINTLNQKINQVSKNKDSPNETINLMIQTMNTLNEKINSLNNTIINNNEIVNSMVQSISSISNSAQKNEERLDNLIITSRSQNGPGLLNELKKREKSSFDHLFVASQSSRYAYDMIDPENTDKVFGTCNKNSFFIEFSIEKPVLINGIQISTSNKRFPKSFNIEVDGKIVASIKEAIELNGENKEMKINFEPIKASKIRFIQTGPNWDENNYKLYIKRIELLSPDVKYSNGVFSTLIKNNKYHDPQRSGIQISTSMFDINTFHMVNSTNNIDTFNSNDQWFQIELTNGHMILDGFRLKKFYRHKLKNYKIICTDDINKPMSSWITLIDVNEQKSSEHKDFDIYEFEKSSPPVKYVRLVQTGPNWSNSNYLSFCHFDLFGKYY